MRPYHVVLALFLLAFAAMIWKATNTTGIQTDCDCANATERIIEIPVTAIVFNDEKRSDEYVTNQISAVLKQGSDCFTLNVEGATWEIQGQFDAQSVNLRVLAYPFGTQTVLDALHQSGTRILTHSGKRYHTFGKIE